MMNTTRSSERILLIEDNRDQAALIERWLADMQGLDVTAVGDGESALRLLEQSRYDLVVSDISLPGMDGLAVAHAVRKAQPSAMVSLITAHDEIDFAVRAIRAKVDDFVRKPLSRDVLVRSVESLLLRARRRTVTTPRTVLAIGAHPDDVEIGCGGRLAQHVAAGDHVVILTLTAGEAAGIPDARTREAQTAAALLGAELRLADLRDTSLPSGAETIGAIEPIVRELRPDLVYTHSQHDTHQDHRAAFQATLVAARNVPTLMCYQSPSATTAFVPTHFADISDVLETKLSAIERYESQVSKCAYLEPELLRATARYWGRFSRNRYVEPFEVVRSSSVRRPSGSFHAIARGAA